MNWTVSVGRSIFSSARNMARVVPVPALSDNLMYVLVDEATNKAAVVDPVDVKAIQNAVESLGVKLESALVTHHHWDHAGGTQELSSAYKGKIKIYGGDERISSLTNKIGDNETFKIGELNVRCLHTPCHTTGHICYYVTDNQSKKIVFTGDTLFIGGCGRFFEGTAEQMDRALNEKLAGLPDETEVYCGHEYTVENLKFAKSVEPENPEVTKKLDWAMAQRAKNQHTVPSTMGEEKLFNPFMRVRTSAQLQGLAGSTKPVDVMAFVRQKKNNFKA